PTTCRRRSMPTCASRPAMSPRSRAVTAAPRSMCWPRSSTSSMPRCDKWQRSSTEPTWTGYSRTSDSSSTASTGRRPQADVGLRRAHQVEHDRQLRLLVLEPCLQVDVFTADVLAGDLLLRRFAELAQLTQCVGIARCRDGDHHGASVRLAAGEISNL